MEIPVIFGNRPPFIHACLLEKGIQYGDKRTGIRKKYEGVFENNYVEFNRTKENWKEKVEWGFVLKHSIN